jgi:hypothetical protein
MCGSYARRPDKQKIAELFTVHGPVLPDFRPSWKVAPQTFQPVVRLNGDGGEDGTGDRVVTGRHSITSMKPAFRVVFVMENSFDPGAYRCRLCTLPHAKICIEDFVRLLIRDFGVRPRLPREEWKKLLAENKSSFAKHATLAIQPLDLSLWIQTDPLPPGDIP